MKILLTFLLLHTLVIAAYSQKDSDIVVTEDVALSEAEEISTPPPPPPPGFTSPFKTINDWLTHLCNTEKPQTQNAIYEFGFYRSQGQYIVYLISKNNPINSDKKFKEFGPFYFGVPAQEHIGMNYKQYQHVQDSLFSQIKEFTKTEKFKHSFLAKSQAIVANMDEVIWANDALKKNPELKRWRDMVLAAIDYNEKDKEGWVIDGKDINAEMNESEKKKAETNFYLGNKAKLQKMFSKATERELYSGDISFNNYIKQKTGYDIDIFADARKRADEILKQNKITNDQEMRDAIAMQNVYSKNANDQQKSVALDKLIQEYRSKKFEELKRQTAAQKHSFYSKDIAIVKSPDGKFSLRLNEFGADEANASTSIYLNIEGRGGVGIYGVKGTNLTIKVEWKDNHTVVIETQKDYQSNMQLHQVQNKDDLIKIEYVEK